MPPLPVDVCIWRHFSWPDQKSNAKTMQPSQLLLLFLASSCLTLVSSGGIYDDCGKFGEVICFGGRKNYTYFVKETSGCVHQEDCELLIKGVASADKMTFEWSIFAESRMPNLGASVTLFFAKEMIAWDFRSLKLATGGWVFPPPLPPGHVSLYTYTGRANNNDSLDSGDTFAVNFLRPDTNQDVVIPPDQAGNAFRKGSFKRFFSDSGRSYAVWTCSSGREIYKNDFKQRSYNIWTDRLSLHAFHYGISYDDYGNILKPEPRERTLNNSIVGVTPFLIFQEDPPDMGNTVTAWWPWLIIVALGILMVVGIFFLFRFVLKRRAAQEAKENKSPAGKGTSGSKTGSSKKSMKNVPLKFA